LLRFTFSLLFLAVWFRFRFRLWIVLHSFGSGSACFCGSLRFAPFVTFTLPHWTNVPPRSFCVYVLTTAYVSFAGGSFTFTAHSVRSVWFWLFVACPSAHVCVLVRSSCVRFIYALDVHVPALRYRTSLHLLLRSLVWFCWLFYHAPSFRSHVHVYVHARLVCSCRTRFGSCTLLTFSRSFCTSHVRSRLRLHALVHAPSLFRVRTFTRLRGSLRLLRLPAFGYCLHNYVCVRFGSTPTFTTFGYVHVRSGLRCSLFTPSGFPRSLLVCSFVVWFGLVCILHNRFPRHVRSCYSGLHYAHRSRFFGCYQTFQVAVLHTLFHGLRSFGCLRSHVYSFVYIGWVLVYGYTFTVWFCLRFHCWLLRLPLVYHAFTSVLRSRLFSPFVGLVSFCFTWRLRLWFACSHARLSRCRSLRVYVLPHVSARSRSFSRSQFTFVHWFHTFVPLRCLTCLGSRFRSLFGLRSTRTFSVRFSFTFTRTFHGWFVFWFYACISHVLPFVRSFGRFIHLVHGYVCVYVCWLRSTFTHAFTPHIYTFVVRSFAFHVCVLRLRWRYVRLLRFHYCTFRSFDCWLLHFRVRLRSRSTFTLAFLFRSSVFTFGFGSALRLRLFYVHHCVHVYAFVPHFLHVCGSGSVSRSFTFHTARHVYVLFLFTPLPFFFFFGPFVCGLRFTFVCSSRSTRAFVALLVFVAVYGYVTSPVAGFTFVYARLYRSLPGRLFTVTRSRSAYVPVCVGLPRCVWFTFWTCGHVWFHVRTRLLRYAFVSFTFVHLFVYVCTFLSLPGSFRLFTAVRSLVPFRLHFTFPWRFVWFAVHRLRYVYTFHVLVWFASQPVLRLRSLRSCVCSVRSFLVRRLRCYVSLRLVTTLFTFAYVLRLRSRSVTVGCFGSLRLPFFTFVYVTYVSFLSRLPRSRGFGSLVWFGLRYVQVLGLRHVYIRSCCTFPRT